MFIEEQTKRFKASVLFTLLSLAILVGIFLSACNGDEECLVVGGVPPAPQGVKELTDEVSVEVTLGIAENFKANVGVATVEGKSYLTQDTFEDVEAYYRDYLQPGWEYRDNIVEAVMEEEGAVSAWSSCTDELVLLMYYQDVDPDGSVLVVLYAKP